MKKFLFVVLFFCFLGPSGVSAALFGFPGLNLMGTPVDAATPSPNPQPPQALGGERSSAQMDLVWLLVGIEKLEGSKNKALALTKAQAKKILPILQSLANMKVIFFDPKDAQDSGTRGANMQGNMQGQATAKREMSPEDMEKLRKQREKREATITKAIEDIEKTLSSKQVQYVDNIDFDPEEYGFANFRGFGGQDRTQWGAGTSASSGQQRPSQIDLQAMRERAEKALKKMSGFYKKVFDMVKKKATS